MENENIGTGSEKKGNPQEVKDAMRSGSAEDVKESVKQLVAKGVSAVAGALKGAADTAEREDVAGTARSAVKQLGETAKALTKEGQTQFDTMKEQVRRKGSPGTGSTQTDLESIETPMTGTGFPGAELPTTTGEMGNATEIREGDLTSGSTARGKGKPPDIGDAI